TKNASTKFVKEILSICLSLLQVNAEGDTPLHAAVEFCLSNVVRVHIKRAKVAQHGDKEPNGRVETAIIHVVEILSRKDPDYPYSANNYGKMPLYMAVEKGCLEMVDVLLSTYTFMSHGSPSGKTALHAAARE
ncbi:hypothetical protein CISIN_1g047641mg, partial [Citrus sinensis]